jgi:lipopolysaccharide/colanic/teichoic acid biosynthesis glycosyltransferase
MMKRCLDLVFACLGLLLVLPLFPVLGLFIKLAFPIGGFSPPEGRLARGFKPPAFSRFLFQSAVKSAESF